MTSIERRPAPSEAIAAIDQSGASICPTIARARSAPRDFGYAWIASSARARARTRAPGLSSARVKSASCAFPIENQGTPA